MTESFDLSLYRLPKDAVLLLDNINTAEELEKRAHRLRPDSVTIYFKDADRMCVVCTKVRLRVVADVTTLQWKDPFVGENEDWREVDLDDIHHIQGHWYK